MPEVRTFQEIVDDFELLEDWDDRYRYVIELGQEMPDLEDSDRVPENKVEGCVSQVWLVPKISEDENGDLRIWFEGDSDAHITRGLIAILRSLFWELTPGEVVDTDVDGALARLDLASHISPQRSNGLAAMVKRIQGMAAEV